MENEKEAEPKWTDLDNGKEGNRFFSPVPERAYKIRFSDVRLENKRFNNTGTPKLTAVCKILSIDQEPSNLVFETKSYTIMRELRKHVAEEKWNGQFILFFLKKKIEGDKTTYIFEDMSEVQR